MDKKVHQGSHLKKIITKAPWYFISSVLTKGIQIFLIPIYTKYLTPSDYGVLSTLNSLTMLMPVFISLYLDSAYTRFYYESNQTEESIREYISTFFWFISIWGILIVLLSFVFAKGVISNTLQVPFMPYIPLAILPSLFSQLRILYFVHLKMQLKIKSISIYEIVTFILQAGLTIFFLLGFDFKVLAKLYGFFLTSSFFSMLYLFLMIKHRLIGFVFSKKILLKSLKYSLPLLPNVVAVWITGLSDRIIISIYKTTSSTGIYSIGYELGKSLSLFYEAIFIVYGPLMFSLMTHDIKDFSIKIKEFFSYYFTFILVIALLISVFSKEAIFILTSSKYHKAYLITPIVIFAYFFAGIYKPFSTIIAFNKKTWIISLGAIGQAILNIGLNILFIPIFGYKAAAWTTLGSMFFYALWMFFWSQRIHPITIDWNKIIKLSLISVLTIACLIFNENYKAGFVIEFIIKISLMIFIVVLLFFFKVLKIIDIKNFINILKKKKT